MGRRIDALFQRERFRSGLRIAERLQAIGVRYGRTPAQVAIAWVLAQPGIVCALTGTTSLAHLEENLATAGWRMPAAELDKLESMLASEDIRLRVAQIRQVVAILEEPVSAKDGMVDLVYVLETLMDLGVAHETDILGLFQRLLGTRQLESGEAQREVEAIRGELSERYLATLRLLEADEEEGPPRDQMKG
jgi:hypothetical protein